MRVRHVLSEAGSGLRRNFTMSLAVIMTMWVSLSLLGAGLLAYQQVELLKGRWYDKVEISVFLCNERPSETCSGAEITPVQRETIESTLRSNPDVAEIFFETKQQAYDDFRQAYEDSPVLNTLSVDQMQESFRVKLKDPQQYRGVVSQVAGLEGVQAVQDLRQYLDPLFRWVTIIQVSAVVASMLLLLAAALQISNAIKLAAYARRREIEIMRSVGASSSYIVLPFLLEALVATAIGVALASGTLLLAVYAIVIRNAQVSLEAFEWIGWSEAGIAVVGVAIVGVFLAIIPTLITTRKYLAV